MKIEYRSINYLDEDDCELLAKWTNDKEIQHLFLFFRDEEAYKNFKITKEHFLKKASRPPIDRPNIQQFILVDKTPVGFIELEIDCPHKKSDISPSAWMDIVIGEKQIRGKGLGKKALEHLENLALKNGALEAEIGVFEYNEIAHALYLKLGYKEFYREKMVAYWDGKKWDDIRMKKLLSR